MNVLLEYLVVVSLCLAAFADDCLFSTQEEQSAKQLQRLRSLRQKTFTTTFNAEGEILTFKFQICANPDSVCPKQPNATAFVEDKDACLGTVGRYNQSFIIGGSNWVSLTFSGGDETPGLNSSKLQDTTITFVCSPAKESFTMVYTSRGKPQQWHYSLILNTKELCGETPVGGLSGGSVFCIIFFTVAGVYFLFGFLYRRFVVKAKGVEQVPNYDMWKEFGNLVADGCDFVCRCGTRQEAKMYQGIGDPLGNDESEAEERDDRLLPM